MASPNLQLLLQLGVAIWCDLTSTFWSMIVSQNNMCNLWVVPLRGRMWFPPFPLATSRKMRWEWSTWSWRWVCNTQQMIEQRERRILSPWLHCKRKPSQLQGRNDLVICWSHWTPQPTGLSRFSPNFNICVSSLESLSGSGPPSTRYPAVIKEARIKVQFVLCFFSPLSLPTVVLRHIHCEKHYTMSFPSFSSLL